MYGKKQITKELPRWRATLTGTPQTPQIHPQKHARHQEGEDPRPGTGQYGHPRLSPTSACRQLKAKACRPVKTLVSMQEQFGRRTRPPDQPGSADRILQSPLLAGEEFERQHLPDPKVVDQRPSTSYGLTQLKKRVEGEAPGSGPEKVGAAWVAVRRAQSGQWS